jgi:hypothetical protein
MVVYFVFMCENRAMKPIEIVVRRDGIVENNGGDESN